MGNTLLEHKHLPYPPSLPLRFPFPVREGESRNPGNPQVPLPDADYALPISLGKPHLLGKKNGLGRIGKARRESTFLDFTFSLCLTIFQISSTDLSKVFFLKAFQEI